MPTDKATDTKRLNKLLKALSGEGDLWQASDGTWWFDWEGLSYAGRTPRAAIDAAMKAERTRKKEPSR